VPLVLAASLPAFPQALEPRRPLPKPDIVVDPALEQRLIVKFRDDVVARATAAGGIESRSRADLSAVRRVAENHGVSFSRLINLPEERLRAFEERAASRSGRAQPDLAGVILATLADSAPECMQAAGEALNALDVVEYVEVETLNVPPPHDPAPPTPNYEPNQTYRDPDPGIDVDYAWSQGAAKGAGVRLTDCEVAWRMDHEDFHDTTITPEPGQTSCTGCSTFHGTAVLGVLCAGDNGFGVTGIASDADVWVYPTISVEEGQRHASAVAKACDDSQAGDVVLLEFGDAGGGPAEVSLTIWTEVSICSDAQVVVVEPAGNGNQNLDGPVYDQYRARGDCGAIIVGAGSSTTGHFKLGFSTYGERVNVQGWGQNVWSTATGLPEPPPLTQQYLGTNAGTSMAGAIVAAACVNLQSYAVDRLCRRIDDPLVVRQILIDSGIPQGTPAAGHIGPALDLEEAFRLVRELGSDCQFRRGDANSSGFVDVSDPSFISSYLFNGGPQPTCIETADANDDGEVNVSDPTYLASWLFNGGPSPPPPGPFNCGTDPVTSPNNRGCAAYAPCP
jgi:hypothetical protein